MFPILPLVASAAAGILVAPGGAYEVRHDETWYPAGPHELAFEADPSGCSLELLGTFPVGDAPLGAALRAALQDRKPGAETGSDTFTALGGRQGAVLHTTRMRGLRLYQMTWAAVPLGDGEAALLALRFEGSAQAAERPDFFAVAGTAWRPGFLRDVPHEDLERLVQAAAAPAESLVVLRDLSSHGGAVAGEVFNGAGRAIAEVTIDVQIRAADGGIVARRLVRFPGQGGKPLLPGQARAFLIPAVEEGQPIPDGVGGARIEAVEWVD